MDNSKYLKTAQRKLKLNLREYDLDQEWNSHDLINSLRKKIIPLLPKGLFDPQDLEHQVLFRLTTFDPSIIDTEIIKDVIEEQHLLVEQRLSSISPDDLQYLFRGLTGRHKDLNINHRLEMKRSNGRYYASNDNYEFEVEFKQIEDPETIDLFTDKLHYIHSERTRGDTFGLFFKGDSFPWAVETTEPSILCKKYKKDALLAHGIDPTKAIELTRLYMLPGSPENAISILDSLVAKHYKTMGIEALFTTTMPMYAKTKGATIAGGINQVLLVKELKHKFVPTKVNGHTCYQQVTNSFLKKYPSNDFIVTNPKFPTLFTVETFMPINNISVDPLPILKDKVIYINRKNEMELEAKFLISDIHSLLTKIRKFATFKNVEYIKDTIWGAEGKHKIRHRIYDSFESPNIEVMYKYKVEDKDGIKTEVEETLYTGTNNDDAVGAIKKQGDYAEENSYEKVRTNYIYDGVILSVDVYPFGTYLEIEGSESAIWKAAKLLDLKKDDSITKNADECYLSWNEEMKLKELWHVRFGLTDRYEKKK